MIARSEDRIKEAEIEQVQSRRTTSTLPQEEGNDGECYAGEIARRGTQKNDQPGTEDV